MSADWITDYIEQFRRANGMDISVTPVGRGRYVVSFSGYETTVTRRKIEAFTAALRERADAELCRG